MKLEKEKTEKLVLGIIIGFIVLTVLITMIFGPRFRRIGALGKEISELKHKMKEAETEIASISETNSKLEKLKTEAEQYKTELSSSSDAWLLGILNKISESVGISFDKRERKENSVRVEQYQLMELDLEFKTGYHKLGEFINQLENASRFINIVRLSIAENKEDVNNHIVKLTVGAFVIMPKEEKK